MRRAERMTSPKAISVLFGLVVLFEMLFLLVLGPQFSEITNDTALLDMTVGYSYEEACRMLESYTPAGRAFYRYIQLADFFFPVVYSLFFLTTIVSLLKRAGFWRSGWRYLAGVPLLAGLNDWLENLSILILLRRYPIVDIWVVRLSSMFGILKFGAILLNIGLLFLLLLLIFFLRKLPALKQEYR